MENFSKILLNILAGIFAILFVVTTVLAFGLYTVEQSAFEAGLYKQALTEENVYQRLPDLIAQELAVAARQPGRSGMLSLFSNLSEQDWRVFVGQLLSPEQLKILAENAVTQILAYLNGESDSALLSLASLKAHLASPQGMDAIYQMLNAQPDCTLEQLAATLAGQQDITLCNPPDTFLFFDLRPAIEAQIKASVSLMPEQIILISPNATRSQDLRDLKNLRTAMRLSPLAPMLCLLLITALVIRTLRGWLAWWGYPLLLAGTISMSLSAFSKPLAAGFFRFAISPSLPENLPADIVDVFNDLMASIVHAALQPVLKVAGIMALAGLIMVALTFLFRKRLRKGQPG